MLKTRPFDPAEYIRTPEAAATYMDLVLADGDPAEIVDALDVVSRALDRVEPKLPLDVGVDRIAGALGALGLRLGAQTVTPVDAEAA